MKRFSIFVPVSFCKHGSRCYGHIFTVTFNNTKVRNISVFFKTVTVDNDVSGAYFQWSKARCIARIEAFRILILSIS